MFSEKYFLALLITAVLFFTVNVAAYSQEPVSVPKQVQEQEAEEETNAESLFMVGAATIDMENESVTVNGWVNMSNGIIELLACGPKGARHKSALVLDVEPTHLHEALIALGLRAGGGLQFRGDPNLPRGDSIYVHVSWGEGDENHRRVRGEELVYNVKDDRTMIPTAWIYSGSRYINEMFMASLSHSLIATYHDPETIIDNPHPTGGDITLYEVNSMLIPPVGTPVVVEFGKHPDISDTIEVDLPLPF